MRQALQFASVAAALTALLTGPAAIAQAPSAGSAFVAFRVDGSHVIATLKVIEVSKQVEAATAEPVARFGYRHFDLPAAWREPDAVVERAGDRWLIHAAPGRTFEAETEQSVGGITGCQGAIGVLLRVEPAQSDAFAALPARYFLAERSVTPPTPKASRSTVGAIPSPSTPAFQGALRSMLNDLLARELPRVRADAEPEIARLVASDVDYHRSWARERRAIDDDMQRGRGALTYDVQSFRLAPDGVPLHFVRAEWKVRGRQGFAASLWLRGDESLELIETNLRPASWLRMFEFQGEVSREHLGLVLNVFDRNQDGWGEVLFAFGGYESLSLSLFEYSATGFHPTGIEFAHGC